MCQVACQVATAVQLGGVLGGRVWRSAAAVSEMTGAARTYTVFFDTFRFNCHLIRSSSLRLLLSFYPSCPLYTALSLVDHH